MQIKSTYSEASPLASMSLNLVASDGMNSFTDKLLEYFVHLFLFQYTTNYYV